MNTRRQLVAAGRASFRWRDAVHTTGSFRIGARTFAVVRSGPVEDHGGTFTGWLAFNPQWVVFDVTARPKSIACVRSWRSAFGRAAWYTVNADDVAAVGAT